MSGYYFDSMGTVTISNNDGHRITLTADDIARLIADNAALLVAVQDAHDNLNYGYRHNEITETYDALCQLQAILQKYTASPAQTAGSDGQ